MASCISRHRLLLPAAALILCACGAHTTAAIRTGLVPLEVDESSRGQFADQQQRQLLQTASTGTTTISPATAANPSAPPHTQLTNPASPSQATSDSLMTSSSPAPVSNASEATGGASLGQTQGLDSIPTFSDGCQYIRGLQFEGQLSAYDDGFKFTKFTLSNLDKFINITGTYWELRAANSPQDCCQLCQTSNKTHAAAAEAATAPSPNSSSGDQPINNTMRDPCLYFTWVPHTSGPSKRLGGSAAPGPTSSVATNSTTQQRVTTQGLTTVTPDRAHQAAGGLVVVAMDDPGVDSPRAFLGESDAGGVSPDGQSGACLLVGGGFSWVDAERSKFVAVSGLLYPS